MSTSIYVTCIQHVFLLVEIFCFEFCLKVKTQTITIYLHYCTYTHKKSMFMFAALLAIFICLLISYLWILKSRYHYFVRRNIPGPAPRFFFGHYLTLWHVPSYCNQIYQWLVNMVQFMVVSRHTSNVCRIRCWFFTRSFHQTIFCVLFTSNKFLVSSFSK